MPAVPFVLPPRRRLLGALAAVAALVSVVVGVTVVVPHARAVAAPQTTVNLGRAAHYTALAADYFDDSGASFYPQDIGTSSTTASVLTGANAYYGVLPAHQGDTDSIGAHDDLVAANNAIVNLSNDHESADTTFSGVITPGVWHWSSFLTVSSPLTFDANNDPNAVFIIKVDGYLAATAGIPVNLVHHANPANVFWQVGSYVTLGAGIEFVGTIIANSYIVIGTGSFVIGKALTTSQYVKVTDTQFGSVFPTPTVDSVTTGQGTAVKFNVLANDGVFDTNGKPTSRFLFSRAKQSGDPLLISPAVGQGAVGPTPAAPTIGGVSCEPTTGNCTYQSPASYVGTDGFDYSLADMGETWNVHVTITVTPLDQTPVLRSDRLVATTGGPDVSFSPLINDSNSIGDPLHYDSLTISGVTQPTEGTIRCPTATCTYSPPKDGFTGTVTGTYTAKSQTNSPSGPSATATITIFIDPVPLAPSGFTDTKSSPFTVSVGPWTSTGPTPTVVTACQNGRPTATVSWGTDDKATVWLVQRRYVDLSTSPAIPGPWVTVASPTPVTPNSFVDTLLGEGNSYQWQVRPDIHRWMGVFSPSSVSTSTSPAVTAGGC